jgi:hypothetical protein
MWKPVGTISLRISTATREALSVRMAEKGFGSLSDYLRALIADDLDWAPAFKVNRPGRPAAAERPAAEPSRTAQAVPAGPEPAFAPPAAPQLPPAAAGAPPEADAPVRLRCAMCVNVGRVSCPTCRAWAPYLREPWPGFCWAGPTDQ